MPDAPVADVPLRRLWIALAVVVIGSFATLLYYGGEVYQEAPPIPVSVVTTDGQVLFTGDQIQAGQDVWRSIGGQELGSIWGMVPTRRRTGPPIGSTERPSGF